MNKEPIVERLIIRDDGVTYSRDLDFKNIKLSEAIKQIDEFCKFKNCNSRIWQYNIVKLWTCRIGWHNFPDLQESTECKDCGVTVQEVRKHKGGMVEVKNIILHIKMNIRRWRDEQLERIKEIIDFEIQRRESSNIIHKGDVKQYDPRS